MLSIKTNANISDELRIDLNKFLRNKNSYPEGAIDRIEYIDESKLDTRREGSLFVYFTEKDKRPLILAVEDKKNKNLLYKVIDKNPEGCLEPSEVS